MDWSLLGWSAVVAVITMDISRAKIGQPIREAVQRIHPALGHLVACPWCLSHWMAIIPWVCRGPQNGTDLFLIIGLAAPQLLVISVLMWFLDNHLPIPNPTPKEQSHESV